MKWNEYTISFALQLQSPKWQIKINQKARQLEMLLCVFLANENIVICSGCAIINVCWLAAFETSSTEHFDDILPNRNWNKQKNTHINRYKVFNWILAQMIWSINARLHNTRLKCHHFHAIKHHINLKLLIQLQGIIFFCVEFQRNVALQFACQNMIQISNRKWFIPKLSSASQPERKIESKWIKKTTNVMFMWICNVSACKWVKRREEKKK